MQAMAEGRRGRWTTTTGREENIAAAMNNSENARWLYYLLVCLFIFLSPTCRLWRRDNDEEDGGDDDGTRGQHVPRRRKYVGYTTCHMQAMAEGQRRPRRMATGREDNMYIAEESTLAILVVVVFVVIPLLSPTCWLWQRDNDGGWWWRQRDMTTFLKKVRWLNYLSVVLVFLKYLFVVSHMLAMVEGRR